MPKSATQPGPGSFRGRGINPKPPEPGTIGRILLQAFRRAPFTAWPPSRLIEDAGLTPGRAYPALSRLLDLGLIAKHPSDDAVIRVILTAHGRRFRL